MLIHIYSLGLIIRDDAASVGDYIGNYICRRYSTMFSVQAEIDIVSRSLRINDFRPTPEKPFVLGLPTGSSPIPTYKRLIALVKDGKLSSVSVG